MAEKRVCSVDGCGKPAPSRGLCGKHRAKLRRYGDPLGSPQPKLPRTCSVVGCGKVHDRRGYCIMHAKRLTRHGSIEKPIRVREIRICTILGCGKRHEGNGYCEGHNRRRRLTGDPLGSVPRRKKPPVPCAVAGCDKLAHTAGLCRPHYTKKWRYGDPNVCLNPNQNAAIPWLMAHVHHDRTDCLTWPFGRNKKTGHGKVRFREKHMPASRAMCILAHGEPPTPKHQAAHECGKAHEGCVNPCHLRWALPYQNHQDYLKHGTKRILSLAQKDEILELVKTMTQSQIAKRFGFAQSSISHFLSGKRAPKHR
jgi:hypothetical protein